MTTTILSPDPPEVLRRVLDGLDLVDRVASHVRVHALPHFGHDDLVSFGREGLLAAARRFDPARGVPFLAWAARRVRGAMLDAVRCCHAISRRGRLGAGAGAEPAIRVARVPHGDPDDHGPERPPSDAEEIASPEDRVSVAQLYGAMRSSVARLPRMERRMLERIYFDDEPMVLVSAELGVSLSWASRLHARGLARVVRDLRRKRVVT